MADFGPILYKVSAKTRMARFVLRALGPFVKRELISETLATAIVMKFVRFTVAPSEGHGG